MTCFTFTVRNLRVLGQKVWAEGKNQNQKSYCAALLRSVIILNLLAVRPNKAQCVFEQLAQR